MIKTREESDVKREREERTLQMMKNKMTQTVPSPPVTSAHPERRTLFGQKTDERKTTLEKNNARSSLKFSLLLSQKEKRKTEESSKNFTTLNDDFFKRERER